MAGRRSRLLLRAGILALCLGRASARTGPAAGRARPTVFLTREPGKNGPLRAELEGRGLSCAEVPCVEHRLLDGAARLPELLVRERWQWVLVTSPEAGALLADAWESAARPDVSVAAVGPGTSKVLRPRGLAVAFEPSKATGAALAAELPAAPAGALSDPVLYPASARAPDTIADGLSARGFRVRRVDAYTTESPAWTAEMAAAAAGAELAAFASPSAVDTWAERAGTSALAVCIGETSARRARELGFGRVRFPARPGLEAWAELIERAAAGEE